MYTKKELMDVLLNLRRLPTLSPVALMLMQSLNEDEPNVERISKIIADDPPITSMILKLANSAMYEARRTIITVQDAVVRLGFKEIRRLAIDCALVNHLTEMPKGLLNLVDFWEHSISVAFCIEEIQIAAHVLEKNGSKAHVVGLLHDIGRLITASYMPEVHQQFGDDSSEIDSGEKITVWEKETIGLDHAQIGAAILENWGVPMEIVNGVRFHHQPDISPQPQRKDSYLVYLSDSICRRSRLGNVGEGPPGEIDESVWDFLRISSDIEDEIVDIVREKVEKSDVMLSIAGLKKNQKAG